MKKIFDGKIYEVLPKSDGIIFPYQKAIIDEGDIVWYKMLSFENSLLTDVSENDWYYKAVLWAVEQGITGGTSATTFSPDAPCTRAQVVTFLYAAQGKPAVKGESAFTDVANDAWYAKPVIWAVQNGITSGIGNNKFGPEQTCTRAQIVLFLYKAVGNK